MTGLARVLVRTFFRQVEVEHAERLDTGRPTVLVADHRNGLVDGLVLMAALHRYPHFLGKSTLFHNPLLWPFLRLAGVVPVHRVSDGGSPDGNAAAFAASDRVLARSGLLAVFPEGISHDRSGLQPLRTGAARIALAAADHTVPDVDTVAVALVYDDKERFRSRALVRVGRPRPVDPWLPRWRAHPHQAVRDLTEELAGRIRHEGPELDEGEDAAALVAVADITARTATVLPADGLLVDRQRLLDTLVAADRGGTRVAVVASLRVAYRQYREDLDRCGLSDAQVAASYRSGDLRSRYLRSLGRVALAAPVAVLGAAIHLVPYGVIDVAARVPANRSVRATVKVVGSFFCYLATYAVVGVLVGRALGPVPGLAAAVGAPVCGYVTLRMAERLHRMGGARRGLRLARDPRRLLDSVVAHRAAVVEAARALVDDDGTTGAGPTPRVSGTVLDGA